MRTSSGIPTFGGETLDPESEAPDAGMPLPSRPARAAANHGWHQRHVVAPNSTAGDVDMCVSREEA